MYSQPKNSAGTRLSLTAVTEDLKAAFRNVVSVDVEDYFHAEAFAKVITFEDWEGSAHRVENNTKRLLEMFSQLNIHATFFILGWVAEHYPALVREIAAAGHELGCHSYAHRLIYRLTPEEFREDTQRAKNVIEQTSGQAIFGYRAPTFSIVVSSLWALDILAELGFAYDSSIFPIHHDRYGIPQAPRFPFRIQTAAGPLVEYPMTTFRLWGEHNLPVAGGGYLRLLPQWYTRLGLRRARQESLPVVSYLHPWEFDSGQPRLNVGLKTRMRHYTNLGKTGDRLKDMLRHGDFTSFRESGLATVAKDYDISGGVKMAQDEARQVAQYWDRIAPEFDAIYTGKKSAAARVLDRVLRRDMYQRFDWVMRKAGDARGLNACDIGCGSGRFVNALAQRGAQVTGLDFAPNMLELGRQLVAESGVANQCNFVLSDVLDWKADDKFDLVIAIGLWDYVADPLARLQVIRGITRGRFLSAWPRAGTWRAAVRKRRLKVAGCPVYFWTHAEVEDYLRRAGFAITTSEIFGQLFCVEAVPIDSK